MIIQMSYRYCIIKSLSVRMFLLCFTLFLLILPLNAQVKGIKANPVAKQLSENGKPVEGETIEPGGQFTGAAPMEVEFTSNVTDASSTLRYEWKISQNADFSSVLLSRFDEAVTYTFTTSGTSYVKLYITDTETSETYESDAFSIVISESELKVPNAFSPNGDGVNDLFKVKHKSLVKFNATVFNRWGQELYKWNNPDEGWDGTYHGKAVKDGVYFIVIKAVGSDGIKYNHKGDINILRGFSGTKTGGTTGE
jgi:gliding motility-associated-like protein